MSSGMRIIVSIMNDRQLAYLRNWWNDHDGEAPGLAQTWIDAIDSEQKERAHDREDPSSGLPCQ